jgi:hypothetical protein
VKKKCGAIVIVVIVIVVVVVVVVVEVGHAHLISLSLWVDKRSTSFLWFGLFKEGPPGLAGTIDSVSLKRDRRVWPVPEMLLRKHQDGSTQLPAEIPLLPTICTLSASVLEYTIASRDSADLYDMYSRLLRLRVRLRLRLLGKVTGRFT